MNIESKHDLKAKINELFAETSLRLDKYLEGHIRSGCGIVDDHEFHDRDYFVPRAFLSAFLEDEIRILLQSDKKEFIELVNNYKLF